MDLKSGKPFWPRREGASRARREVRCAPLVEDIRCDVAIMGAGLTGALIAHALRNDGWEVVVLDKRGVGCGSTSASTALIQYEIDVPLWRLIRMRGRGAAERCYQLCREAIDELEAVAGLHADCEFTRRPSLYLARQAGQVPELRREFRARRRGGFEVEFLDRGEVARRYSFKASAALRSMSAAEVDPLRLTQTLLGEVVKKGIRIVAPVTVQQIEHTRSGVLLRTDGGGKIFAKRLIVAAGFESTGFLRRRLVKLRSTYVLTTEPVACFEGWEDRCLIWDSDRPYCYLRTTGDGRLMIGGGDEDFVDAEQRDALIGRKARVLRARLEKMFPRIAIRPALAWAGTFGDTKDGLPYIGTVAGARRVLFTLCFGANGTNFAMMAAGLARDWLWEKSNRDAPLFALNR
jgi:glycine/D-amino acid oxidase-like deaminating enzyme